MTESSTHRFATINDLAASIDEHLFAAGATVPRDEILDAIRAARVGRYEDVTTETVEALCQALLQRAGAGSYPDYIDHVGTSELMARWRRGDAAGEGMGWGLESQSPEQAAQHMGARVLARLEEGAIVAELSDRLYVVCDAHGPWAVEVACQRDLAAD